MRNTILPLCTIRLYRISNDCFGNKNNAERCEDYRIINLIAHAKNISQRILKARICGRTNVETEEVVVGFRKEETRNVD